MYLPLMAVAVASQEIVRFSNQLQERSVDLYTERMQIEKCDICGCMIKRENAVKGEKEIRMKYTGIGFLRDVPLYDSEYLYTPYYCKRCDKDRQKKKAK